MDLMDLETKPWVDWPQCLGERTVVADFDFRPGAIRKVEAELVAPPVHVNFQPLRALCFSLSRYRRNRLPTGLGGCTPAAVPAAASCSRAVPMYKSEPEPRLVPLLSALPVPVPSLGLGHSEPVRRGLADGVR